MMKQVITLTMSMSLASSLAWSQGTGSTTTTTLPKGVEATKANQPLQTTAKEAMGAADSNIMQTMVLAGGFAAAAYYYCSQKHQQANCALYSAGAGLAGAVVGTIMKPKSQAQNMYNAVTALPCPGGICPPPKVEDPSKTDLTNSGGAEDGSGNPVWTGYKRSMKNLKALGVSVTDKGIVTLPDGTKKNFGDMSSSSLQAAGMSKKDIADFNATVAAMKQKAEAAGKGVDGEDSFSGVAGGGGGRPSGNSSTAAMPGFPGAIPTGPGLGVDRNPAQIAGMSRDLNGEPIGVSADDMWQMMNRRYNLMEKNGSFLSPGP